MIDNDDGSQAFAHRDMRSQSRFRSGRRADKWSWRPLAAGLAVAILASLAGGTVAAAGEAGVARTVKISDFSFSSKVLHADVPVLVEFGAPWCIPCRRLEAALDAVAAELGDQVRIVRINTNWSQSYARRYGVEAIPTLLLFQHGLEVDRATGALSASDVREMFATFAMLRGVKAVRAVRAVPAARPATATVAQAVVKTIAAAKPIGPD